MATSFLITHWFKAKEQFSSSIVARFNNKKLTTRKVDGFRNFKATEIPLYHAMEALPVPIIAHEFIWDGIKIWMMLYVRRA